VTDDSDHGLALATPHQEGSFLAIARAAARGRQLSRLYTTLHTASWAPRVRYVPLRRLRARLERELTRREFSEIPGHLIESVASLSQLLEVATVRIPKGHAAAGRLLYFSKERFDRAASRRVRQGRWSAVVAMNFSAQFTLVAARKTGALPVVNFLDSHPRYQNGLLGEFCGLRLPSHELVSPRSERRIERELAIADLILVPSQFVGRQLVDAGVPVEKVEVRPYGVDTSAFRPDSSRKNSARRLPLRCLYVGQVSHRKGVCVLVEAARLLRRRPVEFHVIGGIVSPDVLENRPDNVRWRGSRLHVGVAELMRQADVFVLPSIEDAFGLVALEAMASALPVVVSNHAGASELITNGNDGLVVPAGDASALANAIETLLESDDMRARIGTAARARVEQGCSWNEYGDGVIALLHERLSGREG
jgi:glycosyltransferase involved in cell wall biosynthesis